MDTDLINPFILSVFIRVLRGELLLIITVEITMKN